MNSEHYYTQNPASKSNPAVIRFICRGHDLSLTTDSGVFSKKELDAGTRILLEAIPKSVYGNVLDLGCGWGPVGICLALDGPESTVTFCDINSRALDLARKNAEICGIDGRFILSDGFEKITDSFDMIVTNPPIRAGKQVIYKMFADCEKLLTPSGALYLVIRKQQGAESALKYLRTIYPAVETVEKSGGFWVIRCGKNAAAGEE